MGTVKNITYDQFPKQSDWLGKQLLVCFHYDTSKTLKGEVVRDDLEEPHRMIIKLENGRYVLATECQYQLLQDGEK